MIGRGVWFHGVISRWFIWSFLAEVCCGLQGTPSDCLYNGTAIKRPGNIDVYLGQSSAPRGDWHRHYPIGVNSLARIRSDRSHRRNGRSHYAYISDISDASSATHSVWAAILAAFHIGSDQGNRPCFSFEQVVRTHKTRRAIAAMAFFAPVRVFIDSYNNPDRLATAVRRPGVLVQAG